MRKVIKMNEGQEKFYNFVLARVKEGSKEKAKALLEDNFEKQAKGQFDMSHINKFVKEITDILKPESIEEVMNIIKNFGSQHISR